MDYIKRYFYTLITIIAIVIFGRKLSGVSLSRSSSNSLSSNINSPSQPVASTAKPQTALKEGNFTGDLVNAYYGNVQVQLVVASGKISNINILSYPNDNGRSQSISSRAIPQLRSEVIQAQSANVNAVSGASFTSQAFVSSVQSALSKASA